MYDSSEQIEFDLSALAERLALAGMPVQVVIAREAGVSQSTVSRASQGLIKRKSKGAVRLWDYTASRLSALAGGDDQSQPLQGARFRVEEHRRPRVRNVKGKSSDRRLASVVRVRRAKPPSDGQASPDLAQAAMDGLRDYLKDSFDPLLVIEQLAVLRRAQDPGSRR